MRLIDADGLPRFGNRKGLVHSADVDNAPTIEAIPIRWLKRWGATNWTSYGTVNEILFEVHFKPIILWAIEDWEKEQSKEQSDEG